MNVRVYVSSIATSDDELHDYEHFIAYLNTMYIDEWVKNIYVEESLGGLIENVWLYHKCSIL